jgi:hypothetical protein
LVPLGTAFVVGLTSKEAKPEAWKGWKFLITAHHVIGNRPAVILRLNRADIAEFTCFPVALTKEFKARNPKFLHSDLYYSDHAEVDLVAISIPDIPHTDPVVFTYSMILDGKGMQTWQVEEGTEVFTVGYFYGYPGQKQNYPISKFGRVALITTETWYRINRRQFSIKLTDEQQRQFGQEAGIQPPQDVSVTPQFAEQGYIIELLNTPGLSGAPVMLKDPQFRVNDEGKFEFRRVPPLILGVIKGLMLSPLGEQAVSSSGVAVVEPGVHLRALLDKLAVPLKAASYPIDLDAEGHPK